MLGKMKQLFEMQKKAKEIKGQLANAQVEVEKLGGKIKMVFDGENNIKDIQIAGDLLREENKELLEANLKACINEASSEVKKIMMSKMKESLGGFNLPGMGM